MNQNNQNEIHKKFDDLNEQVEHLAKILESMIEKLGLIEETTVIMQEEMRDDIDVIKDELKIDSTKGNNGQT